MLKGFTYSFKKKCTRNNCNKSKISISKNVYQKLKCALPYMKERYIIASVFIIPRVIFKVVGSLWSVRIEARQNGESLTGFL